MVDSFWVFNGKLNGLDCICELINGVWDSGSSMLGNCSLAGNFLGKGWFLFLVTSIMLGSLSIQGLCLHLKLSGIDNAGMLVLNIGSFDDRELKSLCFREMSCQLASCLGHGVEIF